MQPFQRTAAIFDIDDSLLDGNAGTIFTWFLYSNREMAPHVRSQVPRALYDYARKRLSEADMVALGSKCQQGIAADKLRDRARIKDGVASDDLVPPIVFKEGKRERVKEVTARHGIDLSRSYLYSDSVADTPLLEEVGHPVVVNPKPAFRSEALRRGWEVAEWKGRWKTEPDAAEAIGDEW